MKIKPYWARTWWCDVVIVDGRKTPGNQHVQCRLCASVVDAEPNGACVYGPHIKDLPACPYCGARTSSGGMR